MQLFYGILAPLLGISSLVAASPTQSASDLMLELNSKATSALENAQAPTSRKKCTIANADVRRDWKALSKKERKAYINAVLCLRKNPSKADPSFAPGDFATNPLFHGSETSMSGDGEFFKHNGSVSGQGTVFIPSGNGGGCIKNGPFVGATANLGPLSPGMDGMEATSTPLEYNPRCLRRDLGRYAIDNIQIMQDEFQGRFPDRFLGLHGAGHFAIGGDSSDLYSPSNEPVFFLHHAMVDRVYWIWQALHPKQARNIAGTITTGNRPPIRDALKSDPLN
ncbi:tyrosinase, partial [Fusarium agapanthi]